MKRCILADHEELPHPHEDKGDCDFYETGDLKCVTCTWPMKMLEAGSLKCTGCGRGPKLSSP